MKKIALLSVFVMAVVIGFSSMPAQALDLVKLQTCWMPEHETFLPWLAKQNGWDKEEGLDLELLFF